jgi:hypothetical protein
MTNKEQPMTKITKSIARKIVTLANAGFCEGVGVAEPGKMCVEAAVCYAIGLPHGDEPKCVASSVREFKIALNDKPWSGNKARGRGLKRCAIAQLGSNDVVGNAAFCKRLSELTIKVIVPIALRVAASKQTDVAIKERLESCAVKCEKKGTEESAREAKIAASSASSAADNAVFAADNAVFAADAADAAVFATDADRDYIFSVSAELAVIALIEQKSHGTKWLDIAPLKLPKCPDGIKPFKKWKGL